MNEANYFWYRNRPAIVWIFFCRTSIQRGGVRDSGHIGTSGKIINGKNGTNANGHQISGTTVFGD